MRAVAVSFFLAWSVAASSDERTMVVHLPEAPIESMSRLAEGVTALAGYIEKLVPGLTLEVKAFRRAEDAREFVSNAGDRVALVLCDAPFLLELPPGFEVGHRFVRAGRKTGQKLLVARSDSGWKSLGDLRGRSLTVTISPSALGSKFLAEEIFRGEIDPSRWFGAVQHETDDFTAIAAVLYARTDSALVSEDNPLLASHLGKDLSSVYASSPVPLSVVALRSQAFSTSELTALARGLDAVAGDPDTEPIRAVLSIDGLAAVEEGSRRIADFLGGGTVRRELEIVLPPAAAGASELEPPEAGAVPFLVGVELDDVPIPKALIDSGWKAPAEGGGAKKGGRK